MEMLQEAIKEVQGQEIPQVEDAQVDIPLTAFIPADYITDQGQKMDAYRAVAAASSKRELNQIEAEWSDRYGTVPPPAQQLLQVMELKQIAKSLGFSRVKPDGKQHVILETPMAEPGWRMLQEKLPIHLQSRFVWSPKKVTVRGLGILKPQRQLEDLIEWLGGIQRALSEAEISKV
jgi:transcription-repair coupling factor (superfamily II helicase)